MLGALCALSLPALASAQDFGVLNSAETINRGNVKLEGAPMVIFGKNGSDATAGAVVSGGYGFTNRFDVEGRVSFFDRVTFFGADAEYWLWKKKPVDVSIAGGFHYGDGHGQLNTRGIDLTFLTSGHVAPKLELYGGLDMAFNSIAENRIDGDYTTVHLVPGIEYAISRDIDLVAEVGIGLNEDSHHYVSGGLAFYFR
jgi:hypothetical protein